MRFVIYAENEPPIILKESRIGNAIGWWLLSNGVEGWYETPSPREDVNEHPILDGGVWPNRFSQGPRTFSLYGAAEFVSTIDTMKAIDRINGLFGKELTVYCEDASGKKHVSCYLSASPDIVLYSEQTLIQFSLIFTCPDPAKYSDPITYVSTNNRIEVVNNGNCDTWPILHAEGNLTYVSATLGNKAVSWTGSAESLDIDFRSGTCSSGTITVDNAFPIPPGAHTVTTSANAGSIVSMTVKSAWR